MLYRGCGVVCHIQIQKPIGVLTIHQACPNQNLMLVLHYQRLCHYLKQMKRIVTLPLYSVGEFIQSKMG